MRHTFIIILGILSFVLLDSWAFAASNELKTIFDKTASLIDTLDFTRLPRGISIPSTDNCFDRYSCRRTLLQLQIYTGDFEGAMKSVATCQEEIDFFKDLNQQEDARVFLSDSLGRLGRYQEAVDEIRKITQPAFKIRAVIQLVDFFVGNREAKDFGALSIVQSAIENSIVEKRPDDEAILHALAGTVLARVHRTDEAQQSFKTAYNSLVQAILLAEKNDELLLLTTIHHPSGITSVSIPEEIFLYDKGLTEKRILLNIIRYQTIAGFLDDAYNVYKNYAFLTDSLKEKPWERYALANMIFQTLVEKGEVDLAINIVKNDDKMENGPFMLIADALSKEGKIKEMFDLLDIPQFKGPQATRGILFAALGVDSPDIVEQMKKRFPEMPYYKMFRMRECTQLIDEGKWDEAMALVKTFEKDGGDNFMFPTSQDGILRSIAYSEWMKGNFDHANEVVAIIQTEPMKEQVASLCDEFNQVIRIDDPKKRRQALWEIARQQFSLLDFEGHHKTAMALLDVANDIDSDDPENKLGGIATSIFTDIRAQQLDEKRRDTILEKGWKMMLDVNGVSHLDRIGAMLHNNHDRQALLKVADFAIQTESTIEKVCALLKVAKEIATIETKYKLE